MKFFPDADPEEMAKMRARDRKAQQDANDFFTILMSNPSEETLEKAEKAIYGNEE
jgi:hypothetical protein